MDLTCGIYCGITVLHWLDMARCRLDVSGFTRSIFLSVLMRFNFVCHFHFQSGFMNIVQYPLQQYHRQASQPIFHICSHLLVFHKASMVRLRIAVPNSYILCCRLTCFRFACLTLWLGG
jgi:hypothetical protein